MRVCLRCKRVNCDRGLIIGLTTCGFPDMVENPQAYVLKRILDRLLIAWRDRPDEQSEELNKWYCDGYWFLYQWARQFVKF